MMKKERNLRLVLSGILLLAVVAAGIGMYRIDNNSRKSETKKNTQLAEETPLSEVGDNEQQKNVGEEASSSDIQSEYEDSVPQVAQTTETPETTPEKPEAPATSSTEETAQTAKTATSNAVEQPAPALNYSQDTATIWPITAGDILIDYSMDGSVYFPTLDVYKYSSALVVSSPVDQEVKAIANSKVLSVTESADTGLTVTMDMGNGYQAVYGQLKDVSLEVDQTVASGTVIGKVAEPTKYYAKEGSNLYLSMTKDGQPIDPVLYLPTEEE